MKWRSITMEWDDGGVAHSAQATRKAEIEKRVGALDGSRFTYLALFHVRERMLWLAGGREGYCIVTLNVNLMEEWWDARGRLAGSDDTIEMVANGHADIHSLVNCLDHNETRRVVRHFLETGERDESVDWIHSITADNTSRSSRRKRGPDNKT